MATILSMIQEAQKRIGLMPSSSVVGSNDINALSLLAFAQAAMWKIRDEKPWPELLQRYTFSLANNVSRYAMPADLNQVIFQTLWNVSQRWPLIGPMSPQEYEFRLDGLSEAVPRELYKVDGWTDTQFLIFPTPTSSEHGQICAFEYYSKTCIRPKTWVTATSFAAGSYCSYNGNIYKTTAGGTTGSTPPTWTGSGSDGGVTWVFQTAAYDTFLADTDEPILDYQDIIEAVVWLWKRDKGFEYGELKEENKNTLDSALTDLNGASNISFRTRTHAPIPLGPWAIPDGNWDVD